MIIRVTLKWVPVLVLAVGVFGGAVSVTDEKQPRVDSLLYRADQIMNVWAGMAIDIHMSVASKTTGHELRQADFTMLTHRNGTTLMLLYQAEIDTPGVLLMTPRVYSLLLPHAAQPVELPAERVLSGDLSHPGFLRVSLRNNYQPALVGAAEVEGVSCWRLELTPIGPDARFGRVGYWVSKQRARPMRITFFDKAGNPLKDVRFMDYHPTTSGLSKPARMVIEDTNRPDERTTLTMTEPKGIKTSKLKFNVDLLLPLREAALSSMKENGGKAKARELVDVLLAL